MFTVAFFDDFFKPAAKFLSCMLRQWVYVEVCGDFLQFTFVLLIKKTNYWKIHFSQITVRFSEKLDGYTCMMILYRYVCTLHELLETCEKGNCLNSIFTSINFISNRNNLISGVYHYCLTFVLLFANYDSERKMLKIEAFLVMFNCSMADENVCTTINHLFNQHL